MEIKMSDPLHPVLIAEARRRLIGESLPRIRKCLGELSQEHLWHRPNENTVSAGNLVLHMIGNIRQWILCGLGEAEDRRQRQKEFDESGAHTTEELITELEAVMAKVGDILDEITQEQLLSEKMIQGFQETGLSILVHVIEHTSYHTGQVTYITKTLNNMDLKYYEGFDLNKTSV